MDERNEGNQSRWPLVCVVGSFVCLFLAWLASAMVVDSDAVQHNSGIIAPSFVASVGIVVLCAPLMLTGIVFALIGLVKNFRFTGGIALLLYVALGIHLFHAPDRVEQKNFDRFVRSLPAPTPPSPPRLPAAHEYLRPHAELRGLALTRDRVVTMGFSPASSPMESGDCIRYWSLNDGSLVQSYPLPVSSVFMLLKDGRAYAYNNREAYVHRFDTGEHLGPFQPLPDPGDRILGLIENRLIIRLSPDALYIKFWDLPAGKELARIKSTRSFACQALTQDDRKLAFVSQDEPALHVVDCLTRQEETFPFNKFGVMDVRFSLDGQSVVLAGSVPEGPPRVRKRGEMMTSVAVPQGLRHFPFGTQITVFDLAQRTNASFVLQELKFSSGATFLTDDRQRLTLVNQDSFAIVDLRATPPAIRRSNGFERVCSSLDGQRIATYGSYPHRLQFWNGETAEKIGEKPLQRIDSAPAHHIEFARDNETVVVLRGGMMELCRPQSGRESSLLIDRDYTNRVILQARQ